MARIFAWLVLVLGLALVLLAIGLVWAASGRGDQAERLEYPVERISNAPARSQPGSDFPALRVVSWNVAYGRGAGTDEDGPWTREMVERNLNGIAERLREWNADIVALQEVDLAASRSHGIDQGEWLANKAGFPYYACVVTWQNNYVPFPYWPPARHYGRMKTGQCVLSRWPLTQNIRHRLPQPAENPFYYNRFYLHRAVQHVRADLGAAGALDIFNVHLEAYGTTNRQEHARLLLQRVNADASAGALVLGDFNALPMRAEKRHGFEDEPDMDFRGDITMRTFDEAGWREALAAETDERLTFTFPAPEATRRLDYIFLAGAMSGRKFSNGRVAKEGGRLSDHLPLVTDLR